MIFSKLEYVRFFFCATLLLTGVNGTIAAPKVKDVMSGTCGNGIQWRLTDMNELFITGAGELESYSSWQVNGETGTIQEHSRDFFPAGQIIRIDLNGEIWPKDEFLQADFTACTDINITGNSHLKSVHGVLYTADGTLLIRCPRGKKGMYAVPEGVDSIGAGAFRYCHQLQSIYLSSTVRVIDNLLGGFCEAFERFEISEDNPYFSVENGVLYNKDKTCLLIYPEGKKDAAFTTAGPLKAVGPNAFVGAAYLERLTLTNQVGRISERAFSRCKRLSSVTLPEGLYYIGSEAFEYCEQLKILTIPSSVRKLGNDICSNGNLEKLTWNAVECELEGHVAFSGQKLKEVVFSERVKRIPDHLIVDATGLKQLNIPMSVVNVAKEAFLDCDNVEEIYWNAIACEDLEMGASLLSHSSSTTSSHVRKFIIGERVQRLPAYVASNLTELRAVVIPGSVKEIGQGAFWNDLNLVNISLGSSVETIGDYAFGHTAIGRMVFPKSIKRCGRCLFSNCKRLSEIVWLPATYTGFSTENNLFFYEDLEKDQVTYDISKQITSVQFGDDIVAVPDAFCAWLSGLTSIYLPSSIQQIGTYAFGECTSLRSVVIPNKIKFIAEGTFYNCSSLQTLVMPATITDIGDHAFRNCTSLVELYLPANLRKIGNGTFYGCMRTKNIQLPLNLQSVGQEAFMFTKSEQPIIIPASLTEIGHIAFVCISTPSFEVNEKNPVYSDKNGMLFNKDKSIVLACPQTMTGKVKLPSSVAEIAEGAFARTQIETVDLPGKLTTIGPNAFYMSAITSITIPKGVEVIKATTFENCKQLQTVKLKNKDTVAEEGAFDSHTILSY